MKHQVKVCPFMPLCWTRSARLTYGRHIAPHDIQVRQLGSGRSRIEVTQSLGIRFEIAPQMGLEDGINAVRMLFPRLYIEMRTP